MEKSSTVQLTEFFTDKQYVDNVSDYLSNNFSKLNGFNYSWHTLITSTPLLFEDIDYFKCQKYIDPTITQKEIEAYKSGQLRELYATFENMLICNLPYYDRIMNFCTMVFLHYVRLSPNEIHSEYLNELPYVINMTPTQIWCCALTGKSSTEWELNYAWNINGIDFEFVDTQRKNYQNNSSDDFSKEMENNWDKNFKLLYTNPIFAKFTEYSSYRTGTNRFSACKLVDKTPNNKLAEVCRKFTRTSAAISENQLNALYEYIREQEAINEKLYFGLYGALKKMFDGDDSQFAIFIFLNEFFIHTAKFSMKVSKDETGKISKDYLANTYECFIAEQNLIETMDIQIEWAKYRLPINYVSDKQILIDLLNEMLKENFRQLLCIRRMNDFGILSKISFTGYFDNYYMTEVLMNDNRIIKTSRVCLSKENAAKYIVNKGYFIIGTDKDVYDFVDFNRKNLVAHYSKYCVPILQDMSEVITLHTLSKNDIIDVVVRGEVNPARLNNKNIKFTRIKNDFNSKNIMQNLRNRTKNKSNSVKKTYWKAID